VEDGNRNSWVLDTNATNHITRSRDIFSKLNSQIYSIVKFGHGSITRIEGWGSMILSCKNGGHLTLIRVYFIHQLKASIISLRQLNEAGCWIDINHGVLHIYDYNHHLLAKVLCDSSRLYFLRLNVWRPICLAARCAEAVRLWHGRYNHLNFGAMH
jgi:hypothetical protein